MAKTSNTSNSALRVLDVGCGQSLHDVDVPDGAYCVGIDIDESALALNESHDELIVADIQSYRFPDESFDIVVCHDVLEHLEDPAAALESIAAALRPGGSVEFRLPWVFSSKALIAKFTPHRFHVWVYRRILRYDWAGKPGFGPYPTYLKWDALTPGRLRKWAESNGMRVDLCAIEESSPMRRLCDSRPLAAALLRLTSPLVDPRFTELRFRAEKARISQSG